ncbi:PIR protein [Plasmodium ovale]|uniref:PIR protein n=1 Tax=Plasmodium ovale TaxID=36330 RepID=A0A1C3KJY1_PLAOA|nr:PIR protein [Plasmodium ovale]
MNKKNTIENFKYNHIYKKFIIFSLIIPKVSALKELDYYKIFFKIRYNFNAVVEDEYEEYMYKNDQVLQNIGIYLVENYNSDYKACKINDDCLDRCKNLNTWLNEKKALYTSNGKCSKNNELWKRYIDKLWDKLQQDMEEEHRCQRDIGSEKEFHKKWIVPNCNNSVPVEEVRNCPEIPPPKESVCPVPTTETSSSCKAVLTTTYVVFGILLFFMYFLKFSSVGMKLNNLIRGEKIKRRNMDKENNDAFIGENYSNMDSLDTRFNVIYNSFQN